MNQQRYRNQSPKIVHFLAKRGSPLFESLWVSFRFSPGAILGSLDQACTTSAWLKSRMRRLVVTNKVEVVGIWSDHCEPFANVTSRPTGLPRLWPLPPVPRPFSTTQKFTCGFEVGSSFFQQPCGLWLLAGFSPLAGSS